jgi:DNA sulfur modification protein DndE
VVDGLAPGDYVLIQFGHNDEVKEKVGRYTTPDEFKANLERYVIEARTKGAIPVLLTPVARRKFSAEGAIQETHPVYADAVREVAGKEKVTLIDLDEKSKALLQTWGADHSSELFNYLEPGEHPNYPGGHKDDTHFNELGARKMAELVLGDIRRALPELAAHIRNRADAAGSQDPSWDHLPTVRRPVFKKDTFNIMDYGAVQDPVRLNTAAINTAIDDAAKKGGGVVLVPAGYWLTGPLVLRSNVNLHIDRAAILQFTADFAQYPLVEGNYEGHPAARCQSPISGTDLENIAITGGGVIDGNGDAWRMVARDRLPEEEWKNKVAAGGVLSENGKTWYPSEKSLKGSKTKDAGVLKPGIPLSSFEDIKDFLRPNLLVLTRCKKVLLEGPSFQNSPAWCLHPLLCEDLTLRDVHVRNPWYAANGDGVDLESCRNVLVENSTFDAGDDGICIKSGRDEEGRKRGKPTENVIVRNDIVYHAHGGFVIGSEMSGGARNIFVSDCSFIGTDIGLRFKTTRGRGGVVEKIFVKNISMRDIVHQAVFLDMYYFSKAPSLAETYGRPAQALPPVTEATPKFRDIHISNIVCDGAEEGIFVRGLPEMHIGDIYLENMVIRADKGAELTAAEKINLKNIRLITAHTDPVVYVENSKDLVLDNIQYGPGAKTLFSINGDQCGNIRVINTDASKAVFNYGATANALQIKR